MEQSEQYDAVWKGTFLGDRRENELWIQCYSLQNFYVEVYYDAGTNKVARLRSFTGIEQLAPYLKGNF
ncbi:hypothetical protein [Mucilaginibacter terrae]|nr:hypothetical protein [Mucilaginibacter terrae]